jgi:hypothetical protein
MNTFNLVKRYRKPLVEIDEKIDRLEEAMTTSGLYSRVQQDSGQEFIPPTMGPAPLGDFNSDDFSWPDQGDGSDPDNLFNAPALTVTDTLGRDIPRYGYVPGVIYHDGDERRDPDYSNFDGKIPLGVVIDGRALASTRLFYLTSEGLNFVMQIGVYTTPGPYTDLQKAFSDWWYNGDKSNLTQKTIYIWGGLQFLVGGYYGASQYYPSDRSISTDPVADRGLYAYTLYVPGTPDNPNFATDPGQRSLPPRVTNIIGRDDLGDPNYYPGPVTNVSPEALNYLLAQAGYIPPYVGRPPRNSPGGGAQNVRGPHQPVKFYPGMGFGPAGPVQPGGFYANSYEPEGEVLSEDLTKNDFARLNKYVKDHPEELEYAFSRYPASDPRLSKLNWKMDEMMRASNDYVDKQFPENEEQTSRVKKILARNIKLSDPKTFKDVKQPATYGKVFGNDPKNRRVNESDPNVKSAARFFRKPKPKTKDQVREERLEELRQLENKFSNK